MKKNEELLFGIFNSIPGCMKQIVISEASPIYKLFYKMQDKVSKNLEDFTKSSVENINGKK